jgi:hypothetical protein
MSPDKKDLLDNSYQNLSPQPVGKLVFAPFEHIQTPQNQMSGHPKMRKWTQWNSPVTVSMSQSPELNNPEQLYEARKSNPTPHYTRLRTTGRNSHDRTYYTSTKEYTEETRWNVSTRHAGPL